MDRVMIILSIILLLTAVTCIIVLAIEHYPKGKVKGEMSAKVLKYGLVHFTTRENAYSIMENGLLPNKKSSLTLFEKDFVWTYVADPKEIPKHLEEIRAKGNRGGYDTAVYFYDIPDEYLARMNCKPKQDIVVYRGKLITENMILEEV